MSQFLLFGSQTCQPCKALKGMFESNGFEHEYIDCTERPDLAADYMVMSTPTLVKVDVNKNEIKRATGQGAAFAMSQQG